MIEFGPTDALVRVDIQNDFCVGGALAAPGATPEFVQRCNALARAVRAAGGAVVDTQDYHPPGHVSFASAHPGAKPLDQVQVSYGQQVLWPDHCVQGTPGAEFHPALDQTLPHVVVRKGTRADTDSYSAVRDARGFGSGLASLLKERGATRVFVCGIAYDFCVGYTAADLKSAAGWEVVVAADYSRSIDVHSVIEMNRLLPGCGVLRRDLGQLP